MQHIGMPRRTAQDTIKALAEMDIVANLRERLRSGCYVITDWSAIKKEWIKSNLQHVLYVLRVLTINLKVSEGKRYE